jgi:hypothetical protein
LAKPVMNGSTFGFLPSASARTVTTS